MMWSLWSTPGYRIWLCRCRGRDWRGRRPVGLSIRRPATRWITIGIGDGCGHVGRGMYACRYWPWLDATRDVSAVTGACLAVRKELFDQVGGFDERFPVNYNDVDLCYELCAPAIG